MTGRRQDTGQESAVITQACNDSDLKAGGEGKEKEKMNATTGLDDSVSRAPRKGEE